MSGRRCVPRRTYNEGMTPLRKLELAWKFRRPLWKYRKLIRYRKQILFAAAGLGAGVLTTAVVRTLSPRRASS